MAYYLSILASLYLVYNYSTCCTDCVLTRSVHQVRVYAFSAPTTRLRVWCTYKALTNQGGGASVYRPRSLLHTINSHHPNKHTILQVFRARGYDSLVLLSVGHGGSFTAGVRRVLFDISISKYQYSFNVYHHSLGTPVGGQFSYVY